MLSSERYELLCEVGAGAFGVVYKARDQHDGRLVALKVLHRCDTATEGRFQREGTLLAKLQHPNIVRYVDHGRTTSGQSYMAMEWLEGATLRERLQRGPLSASETHSVLRGLVGALHAAEQQGIVHRDLKPANVLLADNDVSKAKLLDFGLARRAEESQAFTQLGANVGSPLYMSPEQARGDIVHRTSSDTFSLGSVAYECLTGRAPFHGPTILATLAKICLEEPERLEIAAPRTPIGLAKLIHTMLHKEAEQRPGYLALSEELSKIELDGDAAASALGPETSRSRADKSTNIRAQQRVLCALLIGGSEDEEHSLQQSLRALFVRCGARCEQLREGSRILLFDQRLAPAEQAMAAARCGLAVLDMLPDVPIALCTGRSLLDGAQLGSDLFGRGGLQLLTTPAGTLSVDKTSAAILAERFELHETVNFIELRGERSARETPRTLLGRPTPFVGRDREIARLCSLVDEAVEERTARAVLVTAAAGAGKSRLRYELLQKLRTLDEPPRVIVARGDAIRMATPRAALATALRNYAQLELETEPLEMSRDKLVACTQRVLQKERALPIAAALGELCGVPFSDEASPELNACRRDPQLLSERLLLSFCEWLEAECKAQPVLLCVEDLHWCDAATVRYLDAALRSASAQPLVVMAFARPEVRDLFPTLWCERDLMEVRLPKISARAAEQLLTQVTGTELSPALLAQLVERADGNPFFLEELVRGVHEQQKPNELPDTILGIVQTRLDALGEDAKLVLRAASTFGQVFSAEGLRALLDHDGGHFDLRGWLDLLCARELLFTRGGAEPEYVFRHALIRDAAYALLTDEARTLWHRLAAAWLLQRGNHEPSVLAAHFEQGGLLPEASAWYGKATVRAWESDALDEVVRSGERAVTCGAQGSELGELSAIVAEALSYAGHAERAMQWGLRALQQLEAGQPSWWRAAQVLVVAYLEHEREPERALHLIDHMLRRVPDAGHDPTHVISSAIVACACFICGHVELGERLIEAVQDTAPAKEDIRSLCALRSARAMQSAVTGDLHGGVRHQSAALDILRTTGKRVDVADALAFLGYSLCELGELEAAEQYLLEVRALAAQLGSHTFFNAQQNLGLLYLRSGKLADAKRELTASAHGYAQLAQPGNEAFSYAYLTLVARAQGAADDAQSYGTRALSLAAEDVRAKAVSLATSALVELDGGHIEQAREKAQQAMQLQAEHNLFEHNNLVRIALWQTLVASGEHQQAQQAIGEAHSWLLNQANRIQDLKVRHSFLTRVPENAQIVASALRAVGAA